MNKGLLISNIQSLSEMVRYPKWREGMPQSKGSHKFLSCLLSFQLLQHVIAYMQKMQLMWLILNHKDLKIFVSLEYFLMRWKMTKKIFLITLRSIGFLVTKYFKMFLFKMSYTDLYKSESSNLVDLFCGNQWLSESSHFEKPAICLTVPNRVKSML